MRAATSALIGRPKQNFTLKLWVWELLLTCLALALLAALAASLSEGGRPLGLGQRYTVGAIELAPQPAAEASIATKPEIQGNASSWTYPNDIGPVQAKPQRAQWLNRHAGAVLAVFAACGWITLNIGRGISGARIKLPLIAASWCITAYLIGAFSTRSGLPAEFNRSFQSVSFWLATACTLLLAALWNAWRLGGGARQKLRYDHATASPWIYPGFVLFSGLGWLWLLDWAARGHLDKQFVGIYQIDAIWLAYAALTVIAAHQGELLGALSRCASRLDGFCATRIGMPNVILLSGLLAWTVALAAIGQLDAGDHGQLKLYQRHAALLAELMRVPVWLALGWISYRWVETSPRAGQGLLAMAILLIVLLSGLKIDHDGGPIFAQTIAIVWIASALLQAALAGKFGAMRSWAAATGAAIVGTALAVWMAFLQAPSGRVEAMEMEYRGPLDFLSVMHWLRDATPVFGFGLGKTPWCGYAQAAGLITQCRRGGVPDQIQSDFVVPAMLALWGWLPTFLLLAALLLWLWELQRKGPAIHAEALDLGLLRQWIVMGYAVTSAVQIAISAAGTLGKIPFTGLAIPMLSLGGAGLISTAIFSGLAVNCVQIGREPA